MHYVRAPSSSNKAYLISNEKLGVLLWYFIRCVANHCAMHNTLHCLLSIGKDSSAEYLEFLDVTKIEIYSHDQKSCYTVASEYDSEAVIVVEYRANGMGAIAFSETAVEKLQFVSESEVCFFDSVECSGSGCILGGEVTEVKWISSENVLSWDVSDSQ